MKQTKRLNRRESRLSPLLVNVNPDLMRKNNNKITPNIFHSVESQSLVDYSDETINKNFPHNALIGDPVKRFQGHHVAATKSPYKLKGIAS
jgi:hypothetical protein